MPNNSIRVEGQKELMAKLGRAASAIALEPAMKMAMAILTRRMAEYPSPPDDSSYERGWGRKGGPRTSEKLGQSWTQKTTRSKSRLQGRVGNNVSYGPFVQSHLFQAWMHKDRWQTDQQVVEEEQETIERLFRNAVDLSLK